MQVVGEMSVAADGSGSLGEVCTCIPYMWWSEVATRVRSVERWQLRHLSMLVTQAAPVVKVLARDR